MKPSVLIKVKVLLKCFSPKMYEIKNIEGII